MATKSSSADGQPDPETVTQQSVLQQVPTPDLVTSTFAEDDVPPPTYGDIYGEIRNEKNGLGTSARVTDDGRVDIRINQINRRLSQIFTPALRQQVHSIEDSRPPPPPYIPPSLGGEEGVLPPPPLNIVIQVVGSRGDVQPFVALGKVLKDDYGHRVRLATHPTFKKFVQENGLEFFDIGGDPSRLMAFMVQNPSLVPGFRTLLSGDIGQRRRDVAEYIQGCWRSCYEAGDGMGSRATDHDLSRSSDSDNNPDPTARPFVADCIIANPPSFAHIHCAEKLGIPLHIMFTMPYSPTQAFPHPLANIQSSNTDPQLTNYISYTMIELLTWQGLGDIINTFRARCLGLDPVSQIWAPGMLQRLRVPHTYCWSPALIPKPKDWGPHISISGFYFLNLASDYHPSPDLQAFLDAGPPPVYIGFGSIVLSDPDAMTELIFETVRKTGHRVLLSKGWGGMGAESLQIPSGVFMLGNVPHDWLFKHVSCVVHHGGAGTTAAGITAGRPTVVVPFFGDQPFWGAMVARAGAGPVPIPHKQLTADKLADAISFCLMPESLERAKELATKVATERGSEMGAQSFHQYLELDQLRCTLAPSRAAAWRIKRTQVRLSAFAACTLANANLLDFHDLKLFRPREYNTDEGPWDPLSGGAAACYRAFTGMAVGVAEIPSETWKPLRVPLRSSRQQSRESLSLKASEHQSSRTKEGSTPQVSPEQNQTPLDTQDSLARVQQGPSSHSEVSSPISDVGASSTSLESQDQVSLRRDVAGPSRVRSRADLGSGKNYDMLRQTGMHTSKGLERFVKAAVQAPMGVSVGLTKGFHNLPKLWGDDTVRPQEQISGFKSGAIAAGREFGFGLYDGFTGLVTQPWRGAQKEGASGALKGFGKGIGGFATKPFAGFSGVLGHTMKGIHKEVQKLFGSNVQSYIVASRVAQGYEDWLQSSNAEKEDVIVRWRLIQKSLKGKRSAKGTAQGIPETEQRQHEDTVAVRQSHEVTTDFTQRVVVDAPIQGLDSGVFAVSDSRSSRESLRATGIDEAAGLLVQETVRRDVDRDVHANESTPENTSQLQNQPREEAADHQTDQENLRQAITASESEARRYTSEALEYEKQLKRAMAQSLRKQTQEASDSEWESDTGFSDANHDRSGQATGYPGVTIDRAVIVSGESSGIQRPPSYDRGHLAGTSQNEFEARQHSQHGEKTMQEKTEEEIVMEYVKKQSLLEAQHRSKGKDHATAIKDDGGED